MTAVNFKRLAPRKLTFPAAPLRIRGVLRPGILDVAFDPRLDFLVDRARVAPRGVDRWADDHADDTTFLPQSAPRPEIAGVVRHGHDLAALLRRQQRAARAVAPRLAGRHARALGEHQDRCAEFLHALLALVQHLVHRTGTRLAIDGDTTR